MITIAHSHAEGTVIHGTTRGDGTNLVIKAVRDRWRFSRHIGAEGAWYLPGPRHITHVPARPVRRRVGLATTDTGVTETHHIEKGQSPVRLDDLLKQVHTYAETHAKAQSCRATAAHATVPADRANLNARADFWTQEAAGQYAAITELFAAELAATLYAAPDPFMPVRLPGPDLRHVEVRGVLSDGDRTVTITFDLTQAVTAATLMIALAGIGNDRTGGPIGALVPSMPTAEPS